MSAFLESGRSNTRKTAETKVRFRPGAAMEAYLIQIPIEQIYSACCSILKLWGYSAD